MLRCYKDVDSSRCSTHACCNFLSTSVQLNDRCYCNLNRIHRPSNYRGPTTIGSVAATVNNRTLSGCVGALCACVCAQVQRCNFATQSRAKNKPEQQTFSGADVVAVPGGVLFTLRRRSGLWSRNPSHALRHQLAKKQQQLQQCCSCLWGIFAV